jgi:hypothetical protein
MPSTRFRIMCPVNASCEISSAVAFLPMDIASGASLNSVDGSDGWSVAMAAMSLNVQRAQGAGVLYLEQSAADGAKAAQQATAERYGLGQNVNLLA